MILIALLPGLLFDVLLVDYEVVVRTNFPKSCLQTLGVADVAQEVWDSLARSQQKWDRGSFAS